MSSIHPQSPNEDVQLNRIFHAIEVLTYWRNVLPLSLLQTLHHLTTEKAQQYVQQYQTLYPDNVVYSKKFDSFYRSDGFVPIYSDSTLDEYQTLLDCCGQSLPAYIDNNPLGDVHLLVKGKPCPDALRTLIHAIEAQQAIQVLYGSTRQPEGALKTLYRFYETIKT